MSAPRENEILELLETLGSLEIKLLDFEKAYENEGDYSELVHLMFRLAHNLKSGLGFAGKELCSKLIHDVENTLDLLRGGKLEPEQELINTWLASVDLIKNHIYDETEYEDNFQELKKKLDMYLKNVPAECARKFITLSFPLTPDQFKLYKKADEDGTNIYQIEKLVQTKISKEVYNHLPIYEDIEEAGTLIAFYPSYDLINKTEKEVLVKIIFASVLSKEQLDEILFDPFCPVDPGSRVSISGSEGKETAPVSENGLINSEVIEGFMSEGTDLLNLCEQHILELEKDRTNGAFIDMIFRNVHTLKGNAGLLNLAGLEEAGADFENLLSRIREKSAQVNPNTISMMLSFVDTLRREISGLFELMDREGKGRIKRKFLGEILVELGKASESEINSALNTQVMPLGEVLLEKGVVDKESINEALRIQEKINNKAAGEKEHKRKYIRVDVEKLDKMFDFIGELVTAGNIVENKLKLLEDLLNIDFNGFLNTIDDFENNTRSLAALSANHEKSGSEVLAKKLQQAVRRFSACSARGRTIALRSGDYIRNLQHLGRENFSASFSQFGKIIKDLQEISTKTRMIPLEELFNKMARLVRDLSKKSEKKISLSVSGQDTEMDKNIIEMVQDPLIHILRNAIDHGIENPTERLKRGKSETASIVLDACYEGSEIWITVSDDGQGFDRAKILERAKEHRLVSGDLNSLRDEAVWALVFEPGFSTADKVTQISGRGVGMDVVKKNLDKLRGNIVIESFPGKGTSVKLRIPLTLAIIEGITVKVGGGLFTIPLSDIYEFLQVKESRITRTETGEMIVKLRDEVLPLIRLATVFQTEGRSVTEGIVLVVQHNEKRVCFLIDEIIGNQQIVIKSLKEYLGDLAGIAGCTILGNGDVSLIIDTNRIIDKYLYFGTRGKEPGLLSGSGEA